MENSKIEWTDNTFNPWIGCQKVSHGCDRCYAEAMMDHRYGRVEWGPHGERKRTSEQNWKMPLSWERQARESGRHIRVFCASLADVWDNKVPTEWRVELFELICETPHLDWLLLTKRPGNTEKMLEKATLHLKPWPWPNVWLGTTAEDQEHYDQRWKMLRRIPAAVHFLSYEPALGPIELSANAGPPDWVICGGETGHGARFMKPRWARDLRDQCRELGVAFFMKQMTNKDPIPIELMVRQFPRRTDWTPEEAV